jgi:hypothetical protein
MSKMVLRLHLAFCGCFRHHFLTIDRDTDLKCDNAPITWTAHCFRSWFVIDFGRALMKGVNDVLGGASGVLGGGGGGGRQHLILWCKSL